MTRGIYLDNSTTTKPSEKAVSTMIPFLTEKWGHPSAPHQKGQELFPHISESLENIYALLGASSSAGFVFTSSGAEAINHALFSAYFDITRSNGKNLFLTSEIDEAPALMSLHRLEQLGCVSKLIKPNKNGMITPEMVAESISPRTAMLCLSWANGLTGVINPVKEIAALCTDRGITFVLDATHVLGKLFFNLDEIGADFIAFNGEQFHAPQGTGGLYIKSGKACSPFIVGGLEQAGKRAGSINVPALVALGAAAKEALESRDYVCTETARLRRLLEQGIQDRFPESKLFFQNQERLPHCTTIAFPGISNEALLFALNRKNVFASIGGGSFQQIGLVLTACGIAPQLAQTAINFSLSRTTTEDEIDRACEIIGETATRLRKASTQLIPSAAP
ncbi:MAG: cysteine desulfurase [Parachlamydiaceae bacterium]|nr:cysteine desulfurase [Parachlamydiaceae bacterium]